MLGTFYWIVEIYLAAIIEVIIFRKWEMNYINSNKDSLKENFINFRGNQKTSALAKQKNGGKSMEEKNREIFKYCGDIFSSIERLSPQQNNVLLFFIKTNEYGRIKYNYMTIEETAKAVQEALDATGKKVQTIFMPDTISLFSVADIDHEIERLQKIISMLNKLKIEKKQELDDIDVIPHQIDLTNIQV